MSPIATARVHLEALASQPRPAGGDGERLAREYCAGVLGASGFKISEEPFQYSAFPGRWATPITGAMSLITLELVALAGHAGHPRLALTLLALIGVPMVVGIRWMIRAGVLDAPYLRARSTNLVAVRGHEVALWLVAHLDSKSQPVPIAVRALGVMGTIAAWVLAIVLCLSRIGAASGDGGGERWIVLALLALVAGLPVALTTVGARSDGAVDNASGVVTALLVAQQAPHQLPIGVLLTSGEELGLAGARAWGRSHPRGRAINFDGVDDHGALRMTPSGLGSERLIPPMLDAARSIGAPASRGILIPGVLLDGVALADAGWHVVTVSRGSWRTVARIHTTRDDLHRLTGDGATLAAQVVTRALEGLL